MKKKNIITLLTAWIFLIFNGTVGAKTQHKQVEKTSSEFISTDVVNNLKKETEIRLLDITEEEFSRAEMYRDTLILGLDKNSTTSTLEILGIYAKTAEKKRYYARKFAELFAREYELTRDFAKIVREEQKKIFGNQSMFDYAPQRKTHQLPQSRIQKRVSKVIDLNDCEDGCIAIAVNLINSIILRPVDFYFKNANEASIQKWAMEMNIDPQDVDAGLITLNYFN